MSDRLIAALRGSLLRGAATCRAAVGGLELSICKDKKALQRPMPRNFASYTCSPRSPREQLKHTFSTSSHAASLEHYHPPANTGSRREASTPESTHVAVRHWKAEDSTPRQEQLPTLPWTTASLIKFSTPRWKTGWMNDWFIKLPRTSHRILT